MKTRVLFAFALMGILALGSMSVHSLIPDDADGDGVANADDACPAEDASYFDRDGDGCLDADRGARHIEYWGVADTLITYVVNAVGSPDVGDGSDFTAIQSAMDTWPAITGTALDVVYGGTTPLEDAAALDQVNLVTFVDDEYPFSTLVLAVGISTSFTADSLYNGRLFRAGEIVDTDMIFNPSKTFKTSTAGPGFGTDIQSTGTHEAGHLYGLSHSSVRSSTMFYVLPAGNGARTLETDDELVYLKAYADSQTRALANRIAGVVTDGQTLDPVPGVIVFAIDAATGDTVACDYTLPDGGYAFIGMDDGSYYVSIYPLNGTSPIGFIQPGNINALVEATAVAAIVPEYWDAAESNTDDEKAKTAIAVAGGSTATADLVTNIDDTAPAVVSTIPPDDSVGVAIDGAYVIRFSEPIATGTIAASFHFRRVSDSAGIGGNVAVLNDDSLIAFTPTSPLDFDTDYRLTLDTLLTDPFGNALAPPLVLDVTTETEPPLSISSLSPNKGVVNTTVVINGKGFDVVPPPTVTFDAAVATVTSAHPNQLVVTVPDGAATGQVVVTNTSDASTSNSLTFTLLSDVEIARGYETGVVTLGSAPTSLTLVPDDSYAYVATGGGAEAIIVDPALEDYLSSTGITYTGGLDGVATTPEGRRVYGVSRFNEELVEIMTDPTTGFLFNTVLSSHALGARPFGVLIDPAGRRAYIPTDEAEIQVWDVELGSATYQRQIGAILSPGGLSLRGEMAVTPDGAHLLALTDAGDLLVYEAGIDSLIQTVAVGIDPRDVVVDPAGERAYVSHDDGDLSVVRLQFGSTPSFESQDVATGGSLRGIDVTPAATYIYATDRQLDQAKIIDLDEGNATFRTVIADFAQQFNPIAIELSSDGVYGFSILQGIDTGSPRMVVTTIGLGPTLSAVYPTAAPPGATVVLSGQDLGDLYNGIIIDFNGVTTPDLGWFRFSGEKLVVAVPAGATSGPLKATKVSDLPPHEAETSNERYFTVLDTTPPGGMRFAGRLGVPAGREMEDAIAISPSGDLAFAGGSAGEVYMFDIDPGSPTFHQRINMVGILNGPVDDVAVTADGKSLFAVSSSELNVPVMVANRSDTNFGKLRFFVDFDTFSVDNPSLVATSPDNQWALVYDQGVNVVNVVDAAGLSDGVEPVVVDQAPLTQVFDMVFHPTSLRAYLAQVNPNTIWVLNMDPRSASFGILTLGVPMPTPLAGSPPPNYAPLGMDFTPDGSRLLVNSGNLLGIPHQEIIEFAVPSPATSDTITAVGQWGLGQASDTPGMMFPLRVSPRGDRAVWSREQYGLAYYEIGEDPDNQISTQALLETFNRFDFEFTPDGTRVYLASAFHDSVSAFDFVTAQWFVKVSGDSQFGVINDALAAPIRVKAETESGLSLEGVAIEFVATPGNGGFVTTNGVQSSLVVATDADGFADATWRLGATIGGQFCQAVAPGLSGSPLTFNATATDDPASLPLQLSQVIPINNTADHSVTTAIQATFSRGVDPSSIADSTLWIREVSSDDKVSSAVGFTDNFRKVSLTPLAPLQYADAYEITFTAAILDTSGGGLTNPTATTFATQAAPPPPTISAINPPSGLTGIFVTISGNGFDPVPGNNSVVFGGGATVTPAAGSVDFLRVKVPNAAITGDVFVAAGPDTSNAQPFTVLVPSSSPIDDVIATIGVGGGTKSLAITPDGAVAYTVSTDGDVVIPISVDSLVSYRSIAVGDEPVTIAIHPEGTYAYVTNFASGSLSIIDVVADSPDYNTVVQTLVVGSNPIDVVAIDDRVFVANAGSGSVSIVDGDSSSTTHHSVLATIGVGSSKSLTISPDGARLYIGTDTGFIVMEVSNYSVIATIGVAGGGKSLTITPDGALLYVLTSAGDIVVYNVEPNSPGENSVIATIGVGGGTKSLTISPDGTLLYLVQEDSDEILVIETTVIGGTSALGDEITAPSFTLSFALIDTVETGRDPSAIAFDPSGSGVAVITQAGETDVTVLNASPFPLGTLDVEVAVRPRTLQLGSKGRYVTGYATFPLAFSPHEVKIETVRLEGVIEPEPDQVEFADTDLDGADDRIGFKFDRGEFQEILPQGEYVPVSITGTIRDRDFFGVDTIRTIRPTVSHPFAGQDIAPLWNSYVQWTSPLGYNVHHVDVDYTLDDGASWTTIAAGIPDHGFVSWKTPSTPSKECRVLVTLYENTDEVLGLGMSDVFHISLPVSVALHSFDISVEEGTAHLRWKTGLEVGMVGFHLVRSGKADGEYVRVTAEMIPARGGTHGAAYEYRDESVRPNQTYYYKLQEIAESGAGFEFGPYEVSYRLVDDLSQNVPNPFNPTTAIKFSIAGDAHVNLVVYDVAGRRVRTLVDEPRRADIYKAVWDGRNDQGEKVASGVYFYRLQAGKYKKTLKMLLLK